MSLALWDGVVAVRDGIGTVGPADTPVSSVAGRIDAGEAPARVARDLGLTPRELVAALAFDAIGTERDPVGLPLVHGAARRPGVERALADDGLLGLFPDAGRAARLALAAGLLHVFDHWDASHTAAQAAEDLGETSVSPFWHGVAHRREPDAGNAAYWFRRVGRHALLVPIAEAVQPLLDPRPALAERLIPRGTWQPQAFVEYCSSPRGCDEALARRLQRVEMAVLLEASIPPG